MAELFEQPGLSLGLDQMMPQLAPSLQHQSIPMMPPQMVQQQQMPQVAPAMGMTEQAPQQGQAQQPQIDIAGIMQQNPGLGLMLQQMLKQSQDPNFATQQSKLDAAMGKVADGIANGPSKSERWGNAAIDIFGKLVAPAMAAFGGPGTSQAGLNLAQEARNQVMQAKQLRRQNQAAAMGTLKHLSDIKAATNYLSPKNMDLLAESFRKHDQGNAKIEQTNRKLEQGDDQNMIRAFNAISNDEHKTKTEQQKKDNADALGTYRKNRLKLQERGVAVDEGKLKWLEQLQGLQERNKIELEKLRQTGMNNRNDKSINARMKGIGQRAVQMLETSTRLINQHNTEMEMKAHHVTKNGFVFQNADGSMFEVPRLTPPDPSLIQDYMNFDSVDGGDEDVIAAADKLLAETSGHLATTEPATAAAKAAAVPPPPPGAPAVSRDQALSEYQRRIQKFPEKREAIKKAFLDHYKFDPEPQAIANVK